MQKEQSKLSFYTRTKRGNILRTLALDDAMFWGGDALINLILALYIVTNINGGSAIHVGLAFMLRQLVVAFMSIPVGKFLDRHKGHIDEVYFLSISGFISGAAYLFFSFSTELWQLYVTMLIVGFAYTSNLAAWRVLFYSSLKNNERGVTTGIYQTLMSVSGAVIVGLGGFVADYYGYSLILFTAGSMMALGGFLPLLIKKIVR